jgi:hypothetical protein
MEGKSQGKAGVDGPLGTAFCVQVTKNTSPLPHKD